MATKITSMGVKKCKPFQLQVMVFSPEAGYKFELLVEQACSPAAEPIWKLIFDLYKKKAQGTDFDQIIHVSFTASTPVERRIWLGGVPGRSRSAAASVSSRVRPAVIGRRSAAAPFACGTTGTHTYQPAGT